MTHYSTLKGQVLKGHHDWVNDVVFSPGGDQLASASSDRTVRLRSVKTGDCLKLIRHANAVTRVAYSHKGDLISTSSWDGTVGLWDTTSSEGRAVVRNFQGIANGVSWVPTTEGNYLVTGCQDGSVIKWQVTEEEGHDLVLPCWIATNGTLNVTGTSIQGVGFTPSDMQLLIQRGAIGGQTSQSQLLLTHTTHTTSTTPQMKRISNGTGLDFVLLADDLDEGQQANQQQIKRVNSNSKGRRHHSFRKTT
jgi:WD40 repeat protein